MFLNEQERFYKEFKLKSFKLIIKVIHKKNITLVVLALLEPK